ncbi:MAG TPA: AI-2E family transporter [Candidatus Binataceae bacterium]|jgi:predicted PurR-regulated permease PerM|nr:AI-2E family transporter [Candidatus Binataceae bacterium]
MDRERIVQLFLLGSVGVMAYELYRIIQPFLVPVVWAMLLAFIFHPLMVKAEHWSHRRSLAALSITLLVALVAIVPALWLSTLLAAEARSLYTQAYILSAEGGVGKFRDVAMHSRLGTAASTLLLRVGVKLDEELPKFALQATRATSDTMVGYVTGTFKNLASFVIDFFLMLMILFYLLRDGEGYYHSLRNMTPLHEDDKHAVFESLRVTLSSVMRGLLVTSLLQGVLIGIGLALTGVPYWAFLSLATAIVGLFPIGGTALIWVPATLYLAYASGWIRALVLLVWCAVAVAVIDNVIKPKLTGRGTGLPTLALFLGIAGGLEAYGVPGLFAGPAVIAVLASLLRAYNKSYNPVQQEAA